MERRCCKEVGKWAGWEWENGKGGKQGVWTGRNNKKANNETRGYGKYCKSKGGIPLCVDFITLKSY